MTERTDRPVEDPEHEPPSSLPFDSGVRETPAPSTEPAADSMFTEQPGAGVTDVYGQPLAGDAHGGLPDT